MEQKMVTLKINDIPVTVPEGTTVLEAARNAGAKAVELVEEPMRPATPALRSLPSASSRGSMRSAPAAFAWWR